MKFLSAIVATILLFALAATAETTNALSDAEIQGRNLAQQLLEQGPATNFIQKGILKISLNGAITNIPIRFGAQIATNFWKASYIAEQTNYGVPSTTLRIIHRNGQPNLYDLDEFGGSPREEHIEHFHAVVPLIGSQIMMPFARSDFWLADLGLEFFHWPEQKILKKENRRTRACNVLESINPNPSTNGYSRVLTWIDEESGGIVQAQAYDAKGKLLKEFYPKDIKKVNGQWQLESMEIRNVQTRSRTRIEFDLKAK